MSEMENGRSASYSNEAFVAESIDDDTFHDKGNVEESVREDPAKRRRRLFRQGAKIFLSSLGMWSMGTMYAFPSVVAADLQENNSTIFGEPIFLSSSEMDLLGSILVFFTIPGTWIINPVMFYFGRKISMILSGITLVAGWLGVVFFPGSTGLIAARALCGLGIGGVALAINTYGIEIPDAQVRGFMSVMINNGILAGQVVTMALGYGARYFTVALINLIFPVIFLISQIWLPESPSFLAVRGRTDAARKVLIELRGSCCDIDAEIKGYEAMNQTSDEGRSLWKEFLSAKILKMIAIVCCLFLFMYFSGFVLIGANASRIFKEAGSSIDDSLAAVLITVVQLACGIVASFLLDRLGRKKSLLLSYTMMTIPLAGLAAYAGSTDAGSGEPQPYGWIPLVCLMCAQGGGVFGANPIPFIVSNEYFPTTIRSQASSFCFTVGILSAVVVLQLYTPMMEGMTQTGLYAFYASVCAAAIPFSYFFVKETTGEQVG